VVLLFLSAKLDASFALIIQGDGTPIYPVLRSSSSVKVKVKSQAATGSKDKRGIPRSIPA